MTGIIALTTASSSLACSTVPNSPVGFPKLPKPSTRSPGFSSWSFAGGSERRGFLARSESVAAPGYDSGGCGALRSLGIGLLVVWVWRNKNAADMTGPRVKWH